MHVQQRDTRQHSIGGRCGYALQQPGSGAQKLSSIAWQQVLQGPAMNVCRPAGMAAMATTGSIWS